MFDIQFTTVFLQRLRHPVWVPSRLFMDHHNVVGFWYLPVVVVEVEWVSDGVRCRIL